MLFSTQFWIRWSRRPSSAWSYPLAVFLAAAAQIARLPLDPPALIPYITYVPFISYFMADAASVKEVLDTRKLTTQEVDSILLIDDASEIHWVADPAQLFSLPRRPNEAEISILAYDLWQSRGRPFGSPEVDWFEAGRRLKSGR